MHSFRSIIEATEKSKLQSGNSPRGGGIWTAFRPGEGGVWTKIFQKFKCPGVARGGMLTLRFGWYITSQLWPNCHESAERLLCIANVFLRGVKIIIRELTLQLQACDLREQSIFYRKGESWFFLETKWWAWTHQNRVIYTLKRLVS